MQNGSKTLATQLYDLCIQYEKAEAAGQPVIELAEQIGALRDRLAALRRDSAILQPPAPAREADGDILWA